MVPRAVARAGDGAVIRGALVVPVSQATGDNARRRSGSWVRAAVPGDAPIIGAAVFGTEGSGFVGEREQFVLDTFVELADTLARDYDIGGFLHTLVARCSPILQVTAGGVLLEDPEGRLRLAASSSEQMQRLEEAEIDHVEGPCLDAYRNVEHVVAEDLRTETDRWPTVAPYAVEIGLRSVFACPLRLRDDVIGALNVYREEPGDFKPEDRRLAQAFADVAAIGILQERKVTEHKRRADQLQGALNSRVVIEQAKGVLVARLNIAPAVAFELLRRHSRNTHEPLRSICQRVVDEGFVPPR